MQDDVRCTVVLVTTGDNAVRKKVEDVFCNPVIIDCGIGRTETLHALERSFQAGADVLLTYRCPYLIPEALYTMAAKGAYNIHPSLLPDYPGLNPWPDIFRDAVRNSGVTLHRISPEADRGEIIAQKHFEISSDDTLMTAREKADAKAVELISYMIWDHV